MRIFRHKINELDPERGYGWAIKFPHGNQTNWINQAEQLVLADIFKMRGKSGFTVPQAD